MYQVEIIETVTRTLALPTVQDWLDLMSSVTGKIVELDPDADESDQLYDMINDSSEIMQRAIDHPDAEITDHDLNLEGIDDVL